MKMPNLWIARDDSKKSAIRMPVMSRMIENDETAVRTANNRSIGFFLVDGVMFVKMPMGQG